MESTMSERMVIMMSFFVLRFMHQNYPRYLRVKTQIHRTGKKGG